MLARWPDGGAKIEPLSFIRAFCVRGEQSLSAKMGEVEPSVFFVAVETSDRFDAGSDANVFLTLVGGNGEEFPEIPLKESLNHGTNNFQRKKKDLFRIHGPEVQEISSVKIWHDNTGPNPSWHLSKIQVYDTQKNAIYHFPCNRWIATDEEDGKTQLQLPCQQRTKGPPDQFPAVTIPHDCRDEKHDEKLSPPIVPQQETQVQMWPGYGYGYGGYYNPFGYGYGMGMAYPYGYGGYAYRPYGYGYGGYAYRPYGYGYGGYGYGAGLMWGGGRHSWSWSW